MFTKHSHFPGGGADCCERKKKKSPRKRLEGREVTKRGEHNQKEDCCKHCSRRN